MLRLSGDLEKTLAARRLNLWLFDAYTLFSRVPHHSCPNDQVTSNAAPAHPHATGVAVYPALFIVE